MITLKGLKAQGDQTYQFDQPITALKRSSQCPENSSRLLKCSDLQNYPMRDAD
jgi:hypothetical protein